MPVSTGLVDDGLPRRGGAVAGRRRLALFLGSLAPPAVPVLGFALVCLVSVLGLGPGPLLCVCAAVLLCYLCGVVPCWGVPAFAGLPRVSLRFALPRRSCLWLLGFGFGRFFFPSLTILLFMSGATVQTLPGEVQPEQRRCRLGGTAKLERAPKWNTHHASP